MSWSHWNSPNSFTASLYCWKIDYIVIESIYMNLEVIYCFTRLKTFLAEFFCILWKSFSKPKRKEYCLLRKVHTLTTKTSEEKHTENLSGSHLQFHYNFRKNKYHFWSDVLFFHWCLRSATTLDVKQRYNEQILCNLFTSSAAIQVARFNVFLCCEFQRLLTLRINGRIFFANAFLKNDY